MTVATIIVETQASSAMSKKATDRLAADVETRKAYIEHYIEFLENQTSVFGQNSAVVDAMDSFSSSFDGLAETASESGTSVAQMKSRLQRFYERELIPNVRANGCLLYTSPSPRDRG